MELEDEKKFDSLIQQINKYIPDLKDKIENIAIETQQAKEDADRIRDKVMDLEGVFEKDLQDVNSQKELIEKEKNKTKATNDQIMALVTTKDEISSNSLSVILLYL